LTKNAQCPPETKRTYVMFCRQLKLDMYELLEHRHADVGRTQ